MAFHNGSNYDYNFIIKKLEFIIKEQEFEAKFNCLQKNSEKCKSLSVPIKKEGKRIGINGENYTKTISYKVKFIGSARFIASSLSNCVNNLVEEIHKIKCKLGDGNEKCKACGVKYKDCECCLRYTNVKDNLVYKCLCCNSNHQKCLIEI